MMDIFTNLYGVLIALLSVAVALASAFFVGSKKGSNRASEQAQERADLERARRERAAAKEMVEASDTRRDVENEIERKGADDARTRLNDRWTRP